MGIRALCVFGLGLIGSITAVSQAGVTSPFASQVDAYTSGVLPPEHATYNNPATALGEPTRFTGQGVFPGAVTPFNPAFLDSQIVSIGVGGSLTLQFDHPVTNDPANPYGVDLLVFGNSGYISDLGYGVTSGATFGGSDQGRVEVSQDGVHWFTVTGVQPDGPFPTLGYQDVTDPFSSPAGNVPTDFTKPVNPAFDAAGLSMAQIIAAYQGSGGGTEIDLASVGLASCSFVRVSYLGTSGDLQIDAMADVSPVPGPGTAIPFALTGFVAARWRRR